MEFKTDVRRNLASEAYLEFLSLGGELMGEDLTASLLRRYLKSGIPILAGLSATWLYRTPREFGRDGEFDDIRGEPSGHFVVLCGYNREARTVRVADPLQPNPLAVHPLYDMAVDRVINAILLGILTYDANLLLIEPRQRRRGDGYADPGRRR